MIKNIKRVGIIFLAVAIICLMVIGCLSVNSVTNNGGNVGVLSSEKSNSTNSNTFTDIPVNTDVPTSDIKYYLECECTTNACTCGKLSKIWNDAVLESIATGSAVEVVLNRNWTAGYTDTNWGTSFAKVSNGQNIITGVSNVVGFSKGRITVASNANIILDLNGYTIDRAMTTKIDGGSVIFVDSNAQLSVVDSMYTEVDKNALSIITELYAHKMINEIYKYFATFAFGKIMGGRSENGGGIYATESSILKIYGGMIVENNATLGGGIYSANQVDIFGGLIYRNVASNYGGGIYSLNVNLYDGFVVYNVGENGGGGIALKYQSALNIYCGSIVGNTTTPLSNGGTGNTKGAGILVDDTTMPSNPTENNKGSATINIYGGRISNNLSDNGTAISCMLTDIKMYGGEISYNGDKSVYFADGAGAVYLSDYSNFEMSGGKIINNEKYVTQSNLGVAVTVSNKSVFTITGGEISNNILYNVETNTNKKYCTAIYAKDQGTINLNGGSILNNTYKLTDGTNSVVPTSLFAIMTESEKEIINIGGAVKVISNSSYKHSDNYYYSRDLYICYRQKINITGKLFDDSNIANKASVGIWFGGDGNITQGLYDSQSLENGMDGSSYFINNRTDAKFNCDKELSLTGKGSQNANKYYWTVQFYTNPAWKLQSGYFAIEKYGNYDFNIACYDSTTSSSVDIYLQDENGKVVGEPSKLIKVKKVGKYSFVSAESSFEFELLPIMVDVVWNDDVTFTYDGKSYAPTIKYFVDNSNKKYYNIGTVAGQRIDAGSNYLAVVTDTGNESLKLNPKTIQKTFTINKAKLDKPYGSTTFSYDGKEHSFTPVGYNPSVMNIQGNKQTDIGTYTAVISLSYKGKRNYTWTDGGTENVNLTYEIAFSNYICLASDGTRKTYQESGLIHGVNDHLVNGGRTIMGNISLNTSVQSFIDNLMFESVTLYNRAGEVVYGDNALEKYSALLNNGFELAVGTGWYFEYTKSDNTTERIYISVLGDLTGDGKLNSADVNIIRQVVNNNSFNDLTIEQKLAALIVNKGNTPTKTDATLMWQAVCGEVDISEFI